MKQSGGIVITDLSGKNILGYSARRVSGNTIELNTSTLPSGIYLVKVNTEDGYKITKIVKQ